jgi:hypothetical protein
MIKAEDVPKVAPSRCLIQVAIDKRFRATPVVHY